MVANLVFQDPRYDFIFCFTDTTIPLDSYVTINGTPVQISKVYTAENGWNPGVGNANQGVIGFDFTGTGFAFGDTFNVTNGSYTLPVSSYAPSAGYGYLNFTSDRENSGSFYPGSNIYVNQNYLFVNSVGEFTIEFYFRLSDLGPNQTFLSFETFYQSFPATENFAITWGGGVITVYRPNFASTGYTCSLSTNTWYHLALVRTEGDRLYCYLDGVSLGYKDTWNYDYSNVTTTRLGSLDLYGYAGLNYVYGLSGSMCNVRITENQALYTSNFTPPTLPLSSGANTSLLLLADSDANKFLNSIDNVTFNNVNNPTTNDPVTWSNGPISYP